MSENSFSLDGKNVLITGASSGIGRATAIACSNQGAKLIITGRNEKRLLETLGMLNGVGHKYVPCDLTDTASLNLLVEKTDKLDGIVYCAGTQETCITKMLNKEILQQVMDVNFNSVVLLNALLLKKKKISKSASIVFVSSVAANRVAEIGNAAYSASKGALSAFARVLATELSHRGIRVNTVAPAMIKTNLLEKFDMTAEQFEEDEKKYPMGYGTPEDVAYAIVFLLSKASRWMTGTELLLDGGLTLR